MIRLRASTVIQRSPKDVIAYVADVEHDKDWVAGVVHVQRTDGSPGAAGAKYERVVEAMGRKIKTIVEVASIKPGERAELKATGKVLEATQVYTAKPAGSGTSLEVSFEGEMLGFASMFEGTVNDHLVEQTPKDLERLKAKLEA